MTAARSAAIKTQEETSGAPAVMRDAIAAMSNTNAVATNGIAEIVIAMVRPTNAHAECVTMQGGHRRPSCRPESARLFGLILIVLMELRHFKSAFAFGPGEALF